MAGNRVKVRDLARARNLSPLRCRRSSWESCSRSRTACSTFGGWRAPAPGCARARCGLSAATTTIQVPPLTLCGACVCGARPRFSLLEPHSNIAWCVGGRGGPKTRNLLSLSRLSPASLSRLSLFPEPKDHDSGAWDDGPHPDDDFSFVHVRERKYVCLCLCLCVCARERESMRVCERERKYLSRLARPPVAGGGRPLPPGLVTCCLSPEVEGLVTCSLSRQPETSR